MDRKLLDLLVCPTTRQPLQLLDGRGLQALNAAIGAGGVVRGRRRRPGRAAARGAGDPRPQDRLPRRRRHPGAAGRRSHRHRADRRLSRRMTPARLAPPPAEVVAEDVARALAEDLGSGDVTAALLPDIADSAYLLCKEDAVVCGRPWFDACHRALDPRRAHRLARVRRRSRRRGHGAGHAARPRARAGQRRTRLAQFHADAFGHRDGHRRLRRRRARHRREDPRHAQDPARPAPGAEVRGARGRRRQPPHRPVRRGDAQGEPRSRRRLAERVRSRPPARCIRRCR